jgi:hypothetical protein
VETVGLKDAGLTSKQIHEARAKMEHDANERIGLQRETKMLQRSRDPATAKVRAFDWDGEAENPMSKQQQGQIVETATEARQAEPGPSVLFLLVISLSLAVLILACVWFVFFRT